MNANTKVYPGDQISALGQTVTVWSILYQDAYPGDADIEFIDTAGNYRHWKQHCDGGTVTRSGRPGLYFRTDDRTIIAYIRQRRNGVGYAAGVMFRDGSRFSFGSFRTEEEALARLNLFAYAGRTFTWQKM